MFIFFSKSFLGSCPLQLNVANEKNITVALDTTLTPELKNEGIARELVSRIQNIRKDSGFEVIDRIKITTSVNSEFDNSISNMMDYIKAETLADEIISSEVLTEGEEIEIDELKLMIKIEKI